MDYFIDVLATIFEPWLCSFFYLNTAWRRIATDIKVKVKREWRLQAI